MSYEEILLALSILLTFSYCSYAQSAKSKDMLSEIEGKWELDNNQNVTFSKVFDVPDISKDEIFIRALAYFTYHYNSGEDVIQISDKEKGVIVGKGIYSEVHVGVSLVTTKIDATHVLRIDVKDNKLRAIVTLQQYRTQTTDLNGKYSLCE